MRLFIGRADCGRRFLMGSIIAAVVGMRNRKPAQVVFYLSAVDPDYFGALVTEFPTDGEPGLPVNHAFEVGKRS